MSQYSMQSAPSPSGFDLNLNALAEYAPAPPQLSKQMPQNFSEMGICYKASNNKYPDCPALMDDGRAFTDYRPSCYINDLIRVMNGLHSSYSYRQFLQHNGVQLMDTIRLYNIKKNGCAPCNAVPVQCETLCSVDNHAVSCAPYDCAKGIGRCYQYNPAPQLPGGNPMSVNKSWCDLKSFGGCN
jgi:hypothetical protein